VKKIPYSLNQNLLKFIEKNFDFNKKDINDYEIFCLKILDYELTENSSYSILRTILFNGVISKDEVNDITVINKFYNKIFQINSEFVRDNRFLDFSDIDIAISIISYICNEFNFSSWKKLIIKFYHKENLMQLPCYFVIER
jgi:hypothetical protein